jgi:regulator of RNase E activity RraB
MKNFALIHDFPNTQLLVKCYFDIEDNKQKTSFEANMDDTAMMTVTSDFSGQAEEIFKKAEDKSFCIDFLSHCALSKKIVDEILGF